MRLLDCGICNSGSVYKSMLRQFYKGYGLVFKHHALGSARQRRVGVLITWSSRTDKFPVNLDRMLQPYPSNNCLVALLPTLNDWQIAQNFRWYRIPVKPAPPIVKAGAVRYIAFYFPKAFGAEAYQVKFYAEVTSISIKHRTELFPDEAINAKSSKQYYIIQFDHLQPLHQPISSNIPRRLLFIPTTEFKLFNAEEVNDLFSDSPLEDKIWSSLKQRKIAAQRQYAVSHGYHSYMLDFAIFCKDRNIDLECDGDAFHTKPKHVKQEKARNNALSSMGWSVLRFTTNDIQEHLDESMQLVHDAIRSYGGLK